MLMAVCHSAEAGWARVDDLDRLSDLRAESGNLLWAEADVSDLTQEDIETIAEEFSLHHLAVEDAVRSRQRPKLEPYENNLFMVLHQLNEEDGQLESAQIACFVGERYVLTLHHGAQRTLEEAKERWRRSDRHIEDGSAHLIHTLIDVIVDCYQEQADKLEDEVERLEDIALTSPTIPIQKDLYSVKQRIARLRRYALPVGRVLDWMVHPREGTGFMPTGSAHYFRDVEDHTLRINDQIRNVDELTQAVLDLVRSEQAAALNENSRRLSAWAAIFAVGTLIAGIYGMNFELVPADGTLLGFWFAVVLMVLAGGGLYLYFKRKEWL